MIDKARNFQRLHHLETITIIWLCCFTRLPFKSDASFGSVRTELSGLIIEAFGLERNFKII